MRLRILLGLGAVALAIGAGAPAAALTLGFDCISDNRASDCLIGEMQLSVDISNPGGGKIDFTFHNAGPEMSSITDIYWDETSLLSFSSLTNFPGVQFSHFASPVDLPDWENATPAFRANARLSVEADSPIATLGVNPGEILLVTFSLRSPKTFESALQDVTTGALRVGVRLQGLESCGTESLVSVKPGPPIPEPGTFALVGGGLLVVAARRRRVAR